MLFLSSLGTEVLLSQQNFEGSYHAIQWCHKLFFFPVLEWRYHYICIGRARQWINSTSTRKERNLHYTQMQLNRNARFLGCFVLLLFQRLIKIWQSIAHNRRKMCCACVTTGLKCSLWAKLRKRKRSAQQNYREVKCVKWQCLSHRFIQNWVLGEEPLQVLG